VFLYAFVGGTFNPEEKYKLGWLVVAIIAVYICTHLTIVFGSTLCNIIESCKASCAKCKQKSNNKSIEKEVEKPKEAQEGETPVDCWPKVE